MMRWTGTALAAVALAACGQAPSADADAGKAAPVGPGYEACTTAADGDPGRLDACATAEIARIGQRAPTGAADFATAIRLVGDTAIGGGGEAARATAAAAAVRAARARVALLTGGEMPAATGTPIALTGAAAAAWARSRASSCAGAAVAQCPARFNRLLAFYALSPAQDRPMTTSPAAGLPLPTCAEVNASKLVGGALGDAFYARYPRDLAGEQAVEQVALDPAGIDNVVGYLVCVAGLTDGDPVVVDNGLALFASRRHGAAARARLEAMAQESGSQRDAARRFLAQVRGNLAGPGA